MLTSVFIFSESKEGANDAAESGAAPEEAPVDDDFDLDMDFSKTKKKKKKKKDLDVLVSEEDQKSEDKENGK